MLTALPALPALALGRAPVLLLLLSIPLPLLVPLALALVLSMSMSLTLPAHGEPLVNDDSGDRAIGLGEALALGARQPLSSRARQSALADRARAEATHARSVLPVIGITGQALESNTAATLATPIGDITTNEKSRGQAALTMRLPLFDSSSALQAKADSSVARSSGLEAQRTADQLALAAAERYLDLLCLHAQLLSTESLHRSLLARRERSAALFVAGRMLRADVMAVQVEVSRVAQELTRLQGLQGIARSELAYAVGADEPVDALPLGWQPDTLDAGAPGAAEGRDAAAGLDARADLAAVAERIKGLSIRASAITAEERRPVLDLVAQHVERHGEPLFPARENIAMLQLSIPLFGGGTIDPRQREIMYQRAAQESRLDDAMRAARVDLERASVAFSTAQSLQSLTASSIDSATQSLQVRRGLYDIGRLNLDALLGAEAELARQRSAGALASIDAMRAWLRYQFTLGRHMSTLLPMPASVPARGNG